MTKVKPSALAVTVLSHGRHSFDVAEAAETLGLSRAQTLQALARLLKKGDIVSPARGFYLVVPPEYRTWGGPPGMSFVDSLMTHLGQPYYVALLSAAAVHGASHQAPQVFQVMVRDNTFVRNKTVGRTRLHFYSNSHIEADPVQRLAVPTGYVTVSTKETTVVDLVSKPRFSGGLGNVATILREIGELRGAELARVAARRDRSIARRVGWLIEKFGEVDDIEALLQAARADEGEPTPLAAAAGRRGALDRRWALRVNISVEPDV